YPENTAYSGGNCRTLRPEKWLDQWRLSTSVYYICAWPQDSPSKPITPLQIYLLTPPRTGMHAPAWATATVRAMATTANSQYAAGQHLSTHGFGHGRQYARRAPRALSYTA